MATRRRTSATQAIEDLATLWADRELAHQILLDRFSRGLVIRAGSLLERDVLTEIAAQVSRSVQAMDRGAAVLATRRMQLLLGAVREIVSGGSAAAKDLLASEAAALATLETKWLRQLGRDAIGVNWTSPAPALVRAAVEETTLLGQPWGQWFDEWIEHRTELAVVARVQAGIVAGETTGQIVQGLQGSAETRFETGTLSQTRRAMDVITRTVTTHTATVARQMSFDANSDVVQRERWLGTLDVRTCEVCLDLDGESWAVDEAHPAPPAHPNCVPAGTIVHSRFGVSGATRRWFAGEMIVARTTGGHALTCTPNHPVLTLRGWVPAGALHEGDYVVCDLHRQRESTIDEHDQQVPARVEDVARAFLEAPQMLTVEVPTAAEDFHGDGTQGEIAVVGSDGKLRDRLKAAFAQHVRELNLDRRDVAMMALAGLGGPDPLGERRLPASDGAMSRRGHRLPLLARAPIHARLLLGGAIAPGATVLGKHVRRDSTRDSVPPRDSSRSDAGVELLHHAALHDARRHRHAPTESTAWMPRNPKLDQPTADQLRRYAEQFANLCGAQPGAVELRQVTKVERNPWHGHVFNLETGSGFYVADGVVVHNCRCSLIPDFGDRQGMRASMDGPVPASMDADQWLKEQPRERLDIIFGPTRAAAYERGDLTLEQMLDPSGMRVLTLDELKQSVGDLRAFDQGATIGGTNAEAEAAAAAAAGEAGPGSVRLAGGGGDGEVAAPQYGDGRDGAASVLGVHYSRAERETLDSAFYGTGIRGAEAARVAGDPVLSNRVHFYVGEQIVPEPGVGTFRHEVQLNNLYDLQADPLGIYAGFRERSAELSLVDRLNGVEHAIINAGFDGYYVPKMWTLPDGGHMGAAVLIGPHHAVPVRYVP